jgi:hypothetical protein
MIIKAKDHADCSENFQTPKHAALGLSLSLSQSGRGKKERWQEGGEEEL